LKKLKKRENPVYPSSFYPKALNHYLSMAGLLTHSLQNCLPIQHKNSGEDYFKDLLSSQQRELYRIYTSFPFNPKKMEPPKRQK